MSTSGGISQSDIWATEFIIGLWAPEDFLYRTEYQARVAGHKYTALNERCTSNWLKQQRRDESLHQQSLQLCHTRPRNITNTARTCQQISAPQMQQVLHNTRQAQEVCSCCVHYRGTFRHIWKLLDCLNTCMV